MTTIRMFALAAAAVAMIALTGWWFACSTCGGCRCLIHPAVIASMQGTGDGQKQLSSSCWLSRLTYRPPMRSPIGPAQVSGLSTPASGG